MERDIKVLNLELRLFSAILKSRNINPCERVFITKIIENIYSGLGILIFSPGIWKNQQDRIIASYINFLTPRFKKIDIQSTIGGITIDNKYRPLLLSNGAGRKEIAKKLTVEDWQEFLRQTDELLGRNIKIKKYELEEKILNLKQRIIAGIIKMENPLSFEQDLFNILLRDIIYLDPFKYCWPKGLNWATRLQEILKFYISQGCKYRTVDDIIVLKRNELEKNIRKFNINTMQKFFRDIEEKYKNVPKKI